MRPRTLNEVEAIRDSFAFVIRTPTTDFSAPRVQGSFVLNINPTEYDMQPLGATTLRASQGDVKFEDLGSVTSRITISGWFGAKVAKRLTASGTYEELTGAEYYQEFRAFLEDYNARRYAGEDVELHFHALRYGDHYAVVKPSFQQSKSSKNRIGAPMYTLRMQSYRKLDQSEIPASFFERASSLQGRKATPRNIEESNVEVAQNLEDVRRAVRDNPIQEFYDSVNQALDAGEEYLETANRWANDALRLLVAPALAIERAIALAEQAIQNIVLFQHKSTRVIEIYGRLVDHLAGLYEVQIGWRSLDMSGSVLERMGVASGAGVSALRASQRQTYSVEYENNPEDGRALPPSQQILRNVRRVVGSLSEDEYDTTADRIGRYTGWIPYRVQQGDTIHSIATYELRDTRTWVDIVVLNGLEQPYVGPGDRTARIGDIIRLPVAGTAPSLPLDVSVSDFPGLFDELEDRVFGVDVQLSEEVDGQFDWLLENEHEPENVAIIRGVECFGQRLRKTILPTELGDNLLFPEIGVDLNVGEPDTPENLVLTVLSLRSALLRESAVRRILSERIVEEGTALRVDYALETFGGGNLGVFRNLR